jgi:hypothetical protein
MAEQIRRQKCMGCHSEEALVKIQGPYSNEEEEEDKP